MTATVPPPASAAASALGGERVAPRTPTIWGCTPSQVHDRFWAAFGVQVVRRREPSEIVAGSELFLLLEPGTLVIFRPSQVLETLYWLEPRLLLLRAQDARRRPYREVAVTEGDRLVRFERIYRGARAKSVRIGLTSDREVASIWQNAPDVASPWRWLRAQLARDRVVARPAKARVYDERDDEQTMECLRDILERWERPDTSIGRAARRGEKVWADATADVDDRALCTGAVWVGAGRRLSDGVHVAGPAVLWDDPAARPHLDELQWLEMEPSALANGMAPRVRARGVPGKRAFDVLFILCVLALTLPLYPLVMLAILIEDGRPIFFAHRRETVGGREFPCLKFRSMRKHADAAKAELSRKNQADGPQFFIKDDPRITRVGRILRKLQIDELPQCFNVLLGHMSVVGPRPSPYRENQYCPAWREARLSVRPGLTGLWQVSRTRRKGLDFQEWIRFDLAYVHQASWSLDLWIIWRTFGVIVRGIK